MNKTHFDVARMANTMGVVCNVSIDPTRITLRVKNKLIRWLENGTLVGGYRSEARKLADILIDTFKLPNNLANWRGIVVFADNPVRDAELLALLDADWASLMFEHPNRAEYYKPARERAMKALERGRGEKVYVQLTSDRYREEVQRVINKYFTEEERGRASKALEAITGSRNIQCFVYQ